VSRIAVFDSGLGGTGVLGEIRTRAPWADIIYLADHAFGPFGERTLDEVRTRTALIARFLRSAGASMVVIACNSASAAALHHLREVLPDMVFVGMEPAVKPAAEQTKTGTIAVLATEATFQGELFRSLVGRFAGDTTIIERACPGLALAIERGEPVGELLDRYLPEVAASDADVVVLGCTHYPLIRNEIAARLPNGVTLIDPAAAVAARVLDVAHEHRIDLKGNGMVEMWTTSLDTDRWDGREWITCDVPGDAAEALSIEDTTLVAVQGDITTMPVTAVVNAANAELSHGGGVALAISRAGGDTIDEESEAWIAEQGPLEPGVAALTSAGRMPSTYVIHVAGPIFSGGEDNETLLAAAVIGALDTAVEIDAVSVAMPAISAGVYGYPAAEACQVIAEAAAGYLSEMESTIRSVRLVGFDDAMAERFAHALRSMEVSP
jgi:glutamate racemase